MRELVGYVWVGCADHEQILLWLKLDGNESTKLFVGDATGLHESIGDFLVGQILNPESVVRSKHSYVVVGRKPRRWYRARRRCRL